MHHSKYLKSKFPLICIGILSVFLSSCIETPEEAVSQYEFHGLDCAAQTMVDFSYNEVMLTVFRDSIIPRIIKDYSFNDIVKAADIVKDYTDAYSDIVNSDIDHAKIANGFLSLSPVGSAELYAASHSAFKDVNKVFFDSVLYKQIAKANPNEAVKIHNRLNNTPMGKYVRSINLSDARHIEYLNSLDIETAVKFYAGSRKLFPNIDSIFGNRVVPVLVKMPYPELKSIDKSLAASPFHDEISLSLKQAKSEYLYDIMKEVELCKSQAVEAFDKAVLSGIELEIDSMAEADSKKMLKKFSGGFLGFRKVTLMFGRNESDFEKLWDKYVEGEKYDEVFDKHISSFLHELSEVQCSLYKNIIGQDKKRLLYKLESYPIYMEYPQELINKVAEYVSQNKFSSLKNLGEWIPVVDDIIFTVDYFSDDQEHTEDEDVQMLCKSLILSQVDDSYKSKIRKKAIRIIERSYNDVYNEITKNI